LMAFVCPPPCGRSFDSRISLSIHQGSCQHVLGASPDLDDALAASRARKLAKQARRQAAADASNALHVSSLVFRTHRHRSHKLQTAPPQQEISFEPDVSFKYLQVVRTISKLSLA
jgi:hypothetical protein